MIKTTTQTISFNRFSKFIFFICCFFFLASCSSSQKAPTEDISRQSNSNPNFESDSSIQSPNTESETFEENVLQSNPLLNNDDPFQQELPFSDSENELLSNPNQSPLENVKALVQQQQYQEAQALASRIDRSRLSLQDRASLSLAEAQIYSASNQNDLALNTLNNIQPSLLPLDESSQFFWLKARTQYQLGDIQGSLESLADRENYLSAEEIPSNQSMMMSIINTLSVEEIERISQSTFNSSLLYWLASNQLIAPQQNQFENFSTPLQNNIENTAIINSNWQINSPKKIAVLLPFSSNFSAAAKQFELGFNQAHQSNFSNNKPQIRFYDIGAGDIPNKLSLAIQSGAEFIIGPLGKNAAEIALNYNLPIPMMTIGGIINSFSPGKYTFSLTPEAEGAAIAQHARSQNLQNAIILSSESSQASRLSQAFQQTWQALGGSVQIYEFTPGEYDHSSTVKLALGIYNSEQRFNELSSVIGSNPKFNVSRKDNVDMILLDSSYEDAKNLKPQLNFFDANTVATYGSSSLNRLTAPEGEKADLDGLIIPEMPSLIPPDPDEETNTQPNFTRLSALGYDSYQIIPILNDLQNQQASYAGKTGQLVLDGNNNAIRFPTWAKYSSGQLQVLEPF